MQWYDTLFHDSREPDGIFNTLEVKNEERDEQRPPVRRRRLAFESPGIHDGKRVAWRAAPDETGRYREETLSFP